MRSIIRTLLHRFIIRPGIYDAVTEASEPLVVRGYLKER